MMNNLDVVVNHQVILNNEHLEQVKTIQNQVLVCFVFVRKKN